MMVLARAITQPYSTPTNNRLHSSLNTRNQAVVQDDRVNIQSKNIGNDGRIARRLYNVHEETTEGSNVYKENENVQRNIRTSSSGNVSNVQCYNCNERCHYAHNYLKPRVRDSSTNICMMDIIQPTNVDSDEDSRYDSAFISEVQTPSTSYMNDDHEQTYHEPPKIINSTIGDDQINRNIIFDDPNMKVNISCVDDDKYVHDPYELEQLA
ncbi:hypothetical protein Tco_1102654 [Tanacetum coccineum]